MMHAQRPSHPVKGHAEIFSVEEKRKLEARHAIRVSALGIVQRMRGEIADSTSPRSRSSSTPISSPRTSRR
eukprot:3115182-Rhodomonas_salina.1